LRSVDVLIFLSQTLDECIAIGLKIKFVIRAGQSFDQHSVDSVRLQIKNKQLLDKQSTMQLRSKLLIEWKKRVN
jgi:hypothetical protein